MNKRFVSTITRGGFLTLCLAMLAGCGESKDPVEPAAESPEPTQENIEMSLTDSNKTYQTAGFMVGNNLGINLYSKEELADFIKGLEAANAGEQPEFLPEYLQASQMVVQQKAQQAQMQAQQAAEAAAAPLAEKNIAAGEEFLKSLEGKEGIHKLDSGLCYEILQEGTGPKPTEDSDTVLVNYKGTVIDGRVFDSSYERGQPAEFGLDRVIAGFRDGLKFIGEGGKIRLYVPSKLGYGNRQVSELIQPGTLLIFEVEMLKVNP